MVVILPPRSDSKPHYNHHPPQHLRPPCAPNTLSQGAASALSGGSKTATIRPTLCPSSTTPAPRRRSGVRNRPGSTSSLVSLHPLHCHGHSLSLSL
jgi:hypothetical protein